MVTKRKKKNLSRCYFDPCIVLPGKRSCAVNDCLEDDVVVIDPKAVKPNPKLDLRVVQFLHPGDEHKVIINKGTGKMFTPWNYGRHQRKVIKATGEYVKNGKIVCDELMFWGEWEPYSEATPVSPMPPAGDKNAAHYLHTPILQLNASGQPIWPVPNQPGTNSDPLVFGDSFYYSCCQQLRTYKKTGVTSPTLLHHLERGSIILFGSSLDSRKPNSAFMLDTVFVVEDSRLFFTNNFEKDLKGFVFNDYFPIMGLYSKGGIGYPFRCYKGATPMNSVDGMFSFVPCSVANQQGLRRPLLRQSDFAGLVIPAADIINVKMTQSFKSSVVTLPINKSIWQRLVDVITTQGYELGVKFDFIINRMATGQRSTP